MAIETRDNKNTRELPKVPSLVSGLDDILLGGFPEGRTTLIIGGPGTGKSVLALEFLYRSAVQGEPGIFVTFEERAAAVRRNALTLGWDLEPLEKAGKLSIIEANVDPEAVTSGEFTLKGLMAIVGGQADAIGARRIVFDALDILMRLFDNPARERNELYVLHDWLLDQKMTAIMTVKSSGGNTIGSRYEFLEFMADCVIQVSQHPSEYVSTRQLQIVKYRGSGFGRNPYPFVIQEGGIEVIPISTFDLQSRKLGQYVSSGSDELDAMLGGGYRKGSSILVAGTSGTGKSTLAATFLRAAGERGEKVLLLDYEESEEAVVEAMLSPGIDLKPALKSGKLRIITAMPESMGTEQHLVRAFSAIDEFQPDHVVVDAVSAFKRMGTERAAFEYAMRLVTKCKNKGITVMLVNQSEGFQNTQEISGLGISSIIDTALFLRYIEAGGEVNRLLLVMKSRGSRHSNQYREFRITDNGIRLADIFTAEGEVLTGTLRLEEEARQRFEDRRRRVAMRQKEYEITQKRAEIESEMARLRSVLESVEGELEELKQEEQGRKSGRKERAGIRERGPGSTGNSRAPRNDGKKSPGKEGTR